MMMMMMLATIRYEQAITAHSYSSSQGSSLIAGTQMTSIGPDPTLSPPQPLMGKENFSHYQAGPHWFKKEHGRS